MVCVSVATEKIFSSVTSTLLVGGIHLCHVSFIFVYLSFWSIIIVTGDGCLDIL